MYARVAFFENHDPAQIDELIRRLDERSRRHADLVPGYGRTGLAPGPGPGTWLGGRRARQRSRLARSSSAVRIRELGARAAELAHDVEALHRLHLAVDGRDRALPGRRRVRRAVV